MASLLLVSPERLSGKTTVAAGLAQRIKGQGKTVVLSRIDGDVNSAADAALFASLGDAGTTAFTIAEAPAGDVSALPVGGADRIIVVVAGTMAPGQVAAYCSAIGEALAGVVVNRVPQKRLESVREGLGAAGIKVIATVLEDRVLAAPTLGEIATTLSADATFLNGNKERIVDRPLIASISADPGQDYFSRHGATAVIVRSDKPDLQLAALNAGANCLIVTGGLPILSYVLDRAEEDEIPLLRTNLDTVSVVGEVEALFGTTPFSGGEAKLARIQELMGDIDVSSLLS